MSQNFRDCIYSISSLGIPCCLLKGCKCEEQYTLQKEINTRDTPIKSKTPSELLQDQLEPLP